MRYGNVSSSVLAALGASALSGCATQSPDISIPAAEYSDSFTAARDVLHSYRFTLDRIDARAGVLTTRPSASAGFFTPWSQQESTLSQEWEDTIHNQQRRVEIVFSPALPAATTTPDPSTSSAANPVTREPDLAPNQAREHASDLLEAPRDTNARVVVIVERIYQFGWRPNTKSTVLMSLTEDTQPEVPSRVEVDISDDPALAGRIASEIRSLIAKRANAKVQTPSEEPVSPRPASAAAPAP